MDDDELNLEQLLHIFPLIDFYLLRQNENVDQWVVQVNVEEILPDKVNVPLLKFRLNFTKEFISFYIPSNLSSNKHQIR